MTPPGIGAGLGLGGGAGRRWARRRASTSTGRRPATGQAKLDSAFTPAVSLVRALNVALGLLLDEGLEAAFDRHVRLGRACREGAKAMGLELFSPDDDRSAVVTGDPDARGRSTPASCGWRSATATASRVAGGHGDLKDRLFRIGHIGYYDVFDITTALAAVELALVDAGAEIERGAGVARALEAFAAPALA